MDVLRWIESWRTPLGDVIFSAVTHLGEELVFILAGLLFFWCINKKQGYYLLFVGFTGTVINQFLKLLFRIPRPWVRDPSFSIVESARAEATGYSFPSGHTQSATGVFGGIARLSRRRWVQVLGILLFLMVAVSRLYLGVHTPADVAVSLLVAGVLVFGLFPLIRYVFDAPRRTRWLFAGAVLVSGAFLAFVHLFPFPTDIDPHNLQSGVKNAYKILGCCLGLWLTFEVDERWLHFDTQAVWWGQILKLALGIVPLLLIKEGLRAPLDALFSGHLVADGVRYFLITAFAGAVWPWTFRWLAKKTSKKEA